MSIVCINFYKNISEYKLVIMKNMLYVDLELNGIDKKHLFSINSKDLNFSLISRKKDRITIAIEPKNSKTLLNA